ncbi:MAG: hypothetical protein CW691_02850 [Candidatus Bathyarchaeum sp.]|nr:MAG: hypothetical protein CW691_02850 [Candidatus Bathyarchaeum sp.]
MTTKIAVATVNGRAYYALVTELQRKRLPFLSLKPWDPVPIGIKVVLTTKEESKQISHPKIILFGQESTPESVVDEAILAIDGKQGYEKVVVGLDPGKTCGIAIICDNKVLETMTTSNIEDAAHLIVGSMKRFSADVRLVRVGDGAPEYTKTLLSYLDADLPKDALVEVVREAGTSRLSNESVNRRVLRDTVSAIKIAGRNGRVFSRKNVQ